MPGFSDFNQKFTLICSALPFSVGQQKIHTKVTPSSICSESDKKPWNSLFPQMAPKSNFMKLFVSFSFEPSDPVQFGKISRNLKYCHKYLWTSLNSYLGNITTHIWHFFHGSFCLCAIFIFCRSLLFFFALFFLLFELLHPNDCGGRFFLPKLRKLCLLSLIACKIGFWF